MTILPRPHWDLFCRVVDNFGDAGVCWRLARQLSNEHHLPVRLWIDCLAPLAAIQPGINELATAQTVLGIEICHWPTAFPLVQPADVVIEAFACNLPDSYIAAMEAETKPIAWFNLEYLSAEDWVNDSHGLPSYRTSGRLKKFFFFPGFTQKTGGLLQEANLIQQRDAFCGSQRLQSHDWATAQKWIQSCFNGASLRPADLTVFFFTYQHAPLISLLKHWQDSGRTVNVLLPPGHCQQDVATWLAQDLPPRTVTSAGSLNLYALPMIPQTEFDQLLWLADVNFVRGEDSFVRAQWAGKPFIWQIYPQTGDTHWVKLDAFLHRYAENLPAAAAVIQFWRVWNSGLEANSGRILASEIGPAWQNFEKNLETITSHARQWAGQLDRAGNLANNLVSAAAACLNNVHL